MSPDSRRRARRRERRKRCHARKKERRDADFRTKRSQAWPARCQRGVIARTPLNTRKKTFTPPNSTVARELRDGRDWYQESVADHHRARKVSSRRSSSEKDHAHHRGGDHHVTSRGAGRGADFPPGGGGIAAKAARSICWEGLPPSCDPLTCPPPPLAATIEPLGIVTPSSSREAAPDPVCSYSSSSVSVACSSPTRATNGWTHPEWNPCSPPRSSYTNSGKSLLDYIPSSPIVPRGVKISSTSFFAPPDDDNASFSHPGAKIVESRALAPPPSPVKSAKLASCPEAPRLVPEENFDEQDQDVVVDMPQLQEEGEWIPELLEPLSEEDDDFLELQVVLDSTL